LEIKRKGKFLKDRDQTEEIKNAKAFLDPVLVQLLQDADRHFLRK